MLYVRHSVSVNALVTLARPAVASSPGSITTTIADDPNAGTSSKALGFEDHELEILWEYDAGAQIVNSVAVTDKVVYAATTAGRVIAIAPVAEERLAD